MDEQLKQYTTFTVGNLGFFKCNHMPFGLCNMMATFQRLMQDCLRELNLTYYFIYLNNIIVFLHTAEEHLHCLCIIFDQFREHNLKLKLSKCDFFRNKITYLAHWASKDRIHPSNSNLKAITECTLPQTYMEVHAFLVWWATTGGSSRGPYASHSPLASISLGRRPTGSQSGCHSPKMPWRPLRCWNRCVCWLCQTIPVGVWCTQRWIGGSVVQCHHRSRQTGSTTHSLWQQVPDATWEKLSLHQTQVSSIKVGSYRALQWVPALPVICGADR